MSEEEERGRVGGRARGREAGAAHVYAGLYTPLTDPASGSRIGIVGLELLRRRLGLASRRCMARAGSCVQRKRGHARHDGVVWQVWKRQVWGVPVSRIEDRRGSSKCGCGGLAALTQFQVYAPSAAAAGTCLSTPLAATGQSRVERNLGVWGAGAGPDGERGQRTVTATTVSATPGESSLCGVQ